MDEVIPCFDCAGRTWGQEYFDSIDCELIFPIHIMLNPSCTIPPPRVKLGFWRLSPDPVYTIACFELDLNENSSAFTVIRIEQYGLIKPLL